MAIENKTILIFISQIDTRIERIKRILTDLIRSDPFNSFNPCVYLTGQNKFDSALHRCSNNHIARTVDIKINLTPKAVFVFEINPGFDGIPKLFQYVGFCIPLQTAVDAVGTLRAERVSKMM